MGSQGRNEKPDAGGEPEDALGRLLLDSSNQYDAITDLFLGEVEGATPETNGAEVGGLIGELHLRERPGSTPAPRHAPVLSAGSPVSRLSPPAVRRDVTAGRSGAAPEPGKDDTSPARTQARAARPGGVVTIEALILGHLPVLGAAWAAEYVRRIAIGEGTPVGYIKFGSGRVSVELVPPSGLKAGDAGEAPAGRPAARNVADAVQFACGVTGRWVIRLEDERRPTLKEIEGVDAATVLTSGEDVAVVGAYRAIKELCAEPLGDGGAAPRMRISLMGAPADAAKGAAEKLSGAVAAFIGRVVEVGPPVQRIEGGAPSAVIFSGEAGLDIRSVLAMIRMGSMRKGPVRTPVSAPVARADAPAAPPRVRCGALAGEGALPGPAAPAGLAGHVPGLIPLTARCPFAREVEIAVDPSGTVHLLASVADAMNDGATIRALMVAAAWLGEHSDLVGLTLPDGVPIREAGPPVSRVFVADPKSVMRLLRTGLRVHLVTRGRAEEIG